MIVRKNALQISTTTKWVKTKALRENNSFEVARKSILHFFLSIVVLLLLLSVVKKALQTSVACVYAAGQKWKNAVQQQKQKRSKANGLIGN